jgi:hypothetical protein
MARIVGVHGIGQQLKGAHTLQATWLPALQDGLSLVGAKAVSANELVCAFYGDVFRPTGRKGLQEPPYAPADLEEGFERELLQAWWEAAAACDPQVPTGDTKLRTPAAVQRALRALSGSRFFVGLTERALIGFIKQVHRYFTEPELRARIRDRVAGVVSNDTQVVVAHSLGSVVAYEAVCAHPEWPVRTLVTLGSPLGIRNLIFDRLEPPPSGGVGVWPGSVARWMNVADGGDVFALVKQLQPLFRGRVEDVAIDNGAQAHDIGPYLTAKETGRAIAAGLAG